MSFTSPLINTLNHKHVWHFCSQRPHFFLIQSEYTCVCCVSELSSTKKYDLSYLKEPRNKMETQYVLVNLDSVNECKNEKCENIFSSLWKCCWSEDVSCVGGVSLWSGNIYVHAAKRMWPHESQTSDRVLSDGLVFNASWLLSEQNSELSTCDRITQDRCSHPVWTGPLFTETHWDKELLSPMLRKLVKTLQIRYSQWPSQYQSVLYSH